MKEVGVGVECQWVGLQWCKVGWFCNSDFHNIQDPHNRLGHLNDIVQLYNESRFFIISIRPRKILIGS